MSTNKQHGFTLVEVAIVTPVMILTALGIVAILITLVSSTVGPNARSILMQQEEKALDSMESDINNSSGILSSSLSANFTDTAGGDYSSPPSGTTVLRIQTYDQITNPNDSSGTRVIPAFKDSAACSNITSLAANNIAPIVVVYYVKDNVLYRRTLTDTTTPATCGIKLAKQSCLSGCASKDTALVNAENLSNFSIIYYTGVTNSIETADPTLAKSAKVFITASLEAGGETVEYSSSLRSARLNN
ncbi:MAG: type II secretion system protein [Patescibacteria group bacterium]